MGVIQPGGGELFQGHGPNEANGGIPSPYLADVLLRVQTHPASRIDQLLPNNWKPPQREPSA